MSWQTPTTEQVLADVVAGFSAEMPDASATLRRSNLRVLAKVLAMGLYNIHRFAAYAADQAFVARCAESMLDLHGAQMKPAVPRKLASRAAGVVTMTAAGAATIATGAVLTRADGATYRVDAGIVLSGAGSAPILVTAETAGLSGNCVGGEVLTASTGLTGAATFAVAASGLGGGADIESDSAYRARLLFARAFPEHAGAPADWLRYTLAVPGVSAAYIEPLGAGRGTVVVYPIFSGRPNGVGLEVDRLLVENALAVARPGAGLPVVRLPVARPINVTVTGLAPATPEVRTAVAANLAYTFAAQGRVAGLASPHPSMPFLATPAVFSRSWIWQAVANASGEQSHAITTPSADTTLVAGEIATLGTLTFA